MSRSFVPSVESVVKDKQAHVAAQRVRIENGMEIGNVQTIPKRKSTFSTPKDLVHAKHRTQAQQTARIAELEADLQNLWQHYASSRRQKLDLLDVNSSLETEIGQLKRDLGYEIHMRAKAEAKLDTAEYKPN